MIKNYVFDIDSNQIYEGETNIITLSDYILPTYFDQVEFHEYHQKFADEVFLLCIKSRDKIIGYCYLGLRGGVLKAPYSSPFTLVYLRKNFKINDACLFVDGIKKFAHNRGYNVVSFTLPPEIYNSELINIFNASFFSHGFKVIAIDINNYFDLTKYKDLETHLKNSPHKVRKNYNQAINNELKFEQIEVQDFEVAYDVIEINRNQLGYPLRISKQQMQDLINMDRLTVRTFIVKKGETPLASALIFDVTEQISQVVYWGDVPEYRNVRAMELLALEIFNTYKKLGKKYLDIGPSSENGIINTGLADFKKSIGCNSNIKVVFEYAAN